MTGFYISNLKGIPDDFRIQQADIEEYLENPKYDIARKTRSKFLEDKVFEENEDYIVMIEGVILNFVELKNKYQAKNMFELCIRMLKMNGETFYDEFIGNFAGAYYEKDTDTWNIFVNKYSSKHVFYYIDGKNFVMAPLLTNIRDTLKQHNIDYTFNNDAAYLMLTYGYMGTDDTFIKEVKRLEAGCYIRIVEGKAEVKTYHRFNNYKYDLSKATDDEIIDGIDKRFRHSIKLAYDKDLEYGYKYHLRTLTGGTDSRAAAFVADSLGYKNAVNYTTGQPNYADEKIAREISIFFKNKFIFYASSIQGAGSNFLRNIDQSVYRGQGLSYYFDISPLTEQKIEIDEKSFGLSHGGAFSEAFLTTGYLKNPKMQRPAKPLHTYSELLIDKCPKEHLKKYENEDIYSLYSIFLNKHFPTGRDMLADSQILCIPGIYPDLVEYCLSIPIEKRKNYYIYHKWLFTKYPDAKKFKLEKLNARVEDNKMKKWYGKVTRYGSPMQYLRCSKNTKPTKLRTCLKLDKKIKASPVALSPFDYWYQTDKTSREYMEKYFKENINNKVIDKELKHDLISMYKSDKARPKSMAITVIAAAKLFFD